MKKTGIILAAWVFALAFSDANAQRLLGVVVQRNTKGIDEPLPGATVYWLGTNVNTVTRDNGTFLIDRVVGHDSIVVRLVGFLPDTLLTAASSNIRVELTPEKALEEVTVEGWRPSSRNNFGSTINQVEMTQKELFKAACCNLSESFETNPSVDVAFADAITGSRQIQMLGLAGPNAMISLENMPGVRGLASIEGIQYIPGPWIQSIQVTKGVGSVVNGYESIAGQINVELKKPQESDHIFLNGYMNNSGRFEASAIYTAQTGKKWATTTLVHGNIRTLEMDQNHDSFLDFPRGNQINAINRWTYHSDNGWLGQISLKYLKSDRIGGQSGFRPESDKFTMNRYGFGNSTTRYEATGKLGYQFPQKPYKSFGFQLDAYQHTSDSYYGFRTYNGEEQSAYANFIYQSIINSTKNKFKTGLSFLYDRYDESLNGTVPTGLPQSFTFRRTEIVPGAFGEYSYDDLKRFSATVGIRMDHHNLFGLFVTPRVHVRYQMTPTTTIRASAGQGTRVANIIAENPGFLASSRALVLSGFQTNKGYGYRPDKAWNYGMNLSQDFTLDYRPGVISVDYFYTRFVNQAVVDMDKNTQELNIYGLTGRSFSSSLQVQLDYQLMRHLDLRIAYRRQDVRIDYQEGLMRRPLVPINRAFMNLAYSSRSNWVVDLTVQRIGNQRIPSTISNPLEYQIANQSNPYVIVNTQVTKNFGTKWSVYLGVENLTNFRVSNPIVSANDPFGVYFDSSMIWGPVFGRMGYVGFRFRRP